MSALPPDFVIAGAPRCGTTALYSYLMQHPEIFMPELKEPHYFSPELGRLRQVDSLDAYLALFAPALPPALCGEASVWYLHSPSALARLVHHRPDVRIIVMLRHPVEFLESVHQTLCLTAVQPEPDLAAAWRNVGRSTQTEDQLSSLLDYGSLASFGTQLERLYALVPRSQVLVHLMDELRDDPAMVYRTTLTFLGLQDDGRANFAPVNERMQYRSDFLGKLLLDMPRPLQPVRRALQNASTSESSGPLARLGRGARWLVRQNWALAESSPLQPDARAHIIEHLETEISRSEELLERQLESWRS